MRRTPSPTTTPTTSPPPSYKPGDDGQHNPRDPSQAPELVPGSPLTPTTLAEEKAAAETFKVVVPPKDGGLEKVIIDDGANKEVLVMNADACKEVFSPTDAVLSPSAAGEGLRARGRKRRSRCCGLFGGLDADGDEAEWLRRKRRRKVWLILLLLAVLVVGAAVGGGVGYYAAKKSKTGGLEGDMSLSSNASRTSTATGLSATTTNLSNLAEFGFQAFAQENFEGNKSPVLRDAGIKPLDFMAQSYIWIPQESGCCVTMCRNLTIRSWRCQRTVSEHTVEPFDLVFVGCGAMAPEERGRCE